VLAKLACREPDGQSTARALHDAEQPVVALLDDVAQLRAGRDSARRIAWWLYRNGGEEVRDASGGGDTQRVGCGWVSRERADRAGGGCQHSRWTVALTSRSSVDRTQMAALLSAR
jgi:hypothetical protein